MKLMFATDENTLNSKIAKRFGHANYYLIFDTDNGEVNAKQNHGHSDDHSDLLELTYEGVSHFIIGNIGPQAFEVLKNENAKIYLARKLTANEALRQLQEGILQELNEPTLKRSIDDHQHGEGNHSKNEGTHHSKGANHKNKTIGNHNH